MARKIEKIYIHCSAGKWGNENVINVWHRLRKFLTVVDGYHLSTGYHHIIGNGTPYSNMQYIGYLDGEIETARAFSNQGAGVKSDNRNTIHICLIGEPGQFSKAQIRKLYKILAWHVERGVDVENIWGHYEYWTKQGRDPLKRCPGIDMDQFRLDLRKYIKEKKTPAVKELKIMTVETSLRKVLDLINIILGGTIDK